jgi:hypothetical protein
MLWLYCNIMVAKTQDVALILLSGLWACVGKCRIESAIRVDDHRAADRILAVTDAFRSAGWL